jgi:hypothetical protein
VKVGSEGVLAPLPRRHDALERVHSAVPSRLDVVAVEVSPFADGSVRLLVERGLARLNPLAVLRYVYDVVRGIEELLYRIAEEVCVGPLHVELDGDGPADLHTITTWVMYLKINTWLGSQPAIDGEQSQYHVCFLLRSRDAPRLVQPTRTPLAFSGRLNTQVSTLRSL